MSTLIDSSESEALPKLDLRGRDERDTEREGKRESEKKKEDLATLERLALLRPGVPRLDEISLYVGDTRFLTPGNRRCHCLM